MGLGRPVAGHSALHRFGQVRINLFLDDAEHHHGVLTGAAAIVVQVVLHAVAVEVQIDVGRVTVNVAAHAGLVADGRVVGRRSVAAHHMEGRSGEKMFGRGRDTAVGERFEQQLEFENHGRAQRHVARVGRVVLAQKLTEREVRGDQRGHVGRSDDHEALRPHVGGVALFGVGHVTADALAADVRFAVVGEQDENLDADSFATSHADVNPVVAGLFGRRPAPRVRAGRCQRSSARARSQRTARAAGGYIEKLAG